MADGDDKQAIAGSGGGKGGGQRKPVEAPDSLHSIASAQILDLVSEGPVVGLAAENPLESVFYDETPLANPDGSLNFKDVQLEFRYGTQDQEYIKGFPSVENETGVGVELRYGTPFVRSITNRELSAVRLRLGVPALSKVDEDTNDVEGHRIDYAIDLAPEVGGAYTNVLTASFNGKASSPYARSHRIDLPPTDTGWMLRVRRLTPNADSLITADTTTVDAITEIIDAKLRYPNSAIVGSKVNAEQFPTIPRRAYDFVGRIVRVPSNYDPVARTYDGVWDGTFKPAWTDNPAWIYMDAVLHPRYGMGHRITADQVDHWALYRIARICDEMVPDGKGGLEPRYTCNIYIQQRVEAYRLLQDLASIFNGIAYYANNRIVAGIDAPSDPVLPYTNANVIDGRFTYTGSGKGTRATVAMVTWYDPDDFHRPKVEPVVDHEGVARYGIEQIDLIATGCTSRGQAQRAGWWGLLTGRMETGGVTFGLSLNGDFALPGQIVTVADAKRAGRRIGGRIAAATVSSVVVDALPEVTPVAGDRVTALLPSGFVEKRNVLSVDVESRTLTTQPFSEVPVAGGSWIIETDDLAPQLYRVVSVTEDAGSSDSEGGPTYTVSCVEHRPEKFAHIDGNVIVEGPPTTQLPSSVQLAPAYVQLTAVERAGRVVASPMLAIDWPQTAGAVRYGVAYRRSDGDWVELPTTTANRAEVENVFKGTYLAQVWAYNAAGVVSGRTTSEPFVFGDQTLLPGVIVEQEEAIQSTKEIVEEMELDFADMDARVDQVRDDAQAAAAALNLRADQLRDDIDATMAQLNDILGAEEWDAGTAYDEGDLVQFEGKLFRATQNVPAGTPTSNTAYWELIGDYASLGDAVAAALSQLSAHADELLAHAESLNLLGAKNGAGTAWLLNMDTVRVSASETMAQWRSSLQSQFGDANARIDAEETARADGDSALATTLATVQATANNAATKAELTSAQNALSAADQALGERIDLTQAAIGGIVTVANPSFESDTGWGDNPGSNALPTGAEYVWSQSTARRSGNYSLSLSAGVSVFNSRIVATQAGDVFYVAAWARSLATAVPAAGSEARIGMRAYDADGEFISGSQQLFVVAVSPGSNFDWTYGGGEYTVPDTAVGVSVYLAASTSTGAGTWLIDDVTIDRVTQTDRALASLLNSTRADVQTNATGIAANTSQIALHTTAIAGKADTTYVQAVEGTATAAQGQASANLTAINGLTATAGGHSASINELREVSVSTADVVILDAGFEEMTGWGSSPTNNTLPTGARYVYSTSSAVRSGQRSLGMLADTIVYNTRMAPAASGDRFAMRLWARSLSSAVPSSGAGMEIGMRAYDAGGNFISGSNASYPVVTSTGSNFGWTVGDAEYVAPAGTVYVSAYLRTRADTGSGEWLVDDVRVERISATLESVLARYSLVVTAGGDVAGMQLLAGGGESAIRFLANSMDVVDPGGASGWSLVGGIATWRKGSHMVVIGPGFGANNEFMYWSGPIQSSLANCRRNNAIRYETVTGESFQRGGIIAGTRVHSGFNPGLAVPSIYTTPTLGTGGNPISVNASVGYFRQIRGSTIDAVFVPGSGSNTATLQLWRKIGSGAWQMVASQTFTGHMIINNDPETFSTAIWNITGAITYTDTAGGTQNRQYEARLVSRITQGVNTQNPAHGATPMDESQSVGIVTEEDP